MCIFFGIFEYIYIESKTLSTMAAPFTQYLSALEALQERLGFEPDASQSRSDMCNQLERLLIGSEGIQIMSNQREPQTIRSSGDEIDVSYMVNTFTIRNDHGDTTIKFVTMVKIYPGDPKSGMRGEISGKSRAQYYDERSIHSEFPRTCGKTYKHAWEEPMCEWVESEQETCKRVFDGTVKYIKKGVGIHYNGDEFYVFSDTTVYVDGHTDEDHDEEDHAEDEEDHAAVDDTAAFKLVYKNRQIEPEEFREWLNTQHVDSRKKYEIEQIAKQTSTVGSQKKGFAFESAGDADALSSMFGDGGDY